jgi:hypothetical protein
MVCAARTKFRSQSVCSAEVLINAVTGHQVQLPPKELRRRDVLLRIFGRKRIHNRRPSRINSFENESSVIDGMVQVKLFRHIRFVRVHVDEFACSQNSRSEQNGELSLLCHFIGYTRFCTSPPDMPRPFASSGYGHQGRGSGHAGK